MGRNVTKGSKPKNGEFKIGERIKYIRKNSLMSQEQLASLIDRKREEITMYEKGTRGFDFQTLVSIADALNVSTDYLLSRTEFESFGDDTIITHKTTGLSDKAIKNLINLKEYGNGYLLDTINFLLEQEEYPYETELSHELLLEDSKLEVSDERRKKINSMIEDDYNKHIRNWQDKNLQHIIVAIDEFLHIKIDKEEKLYLTYNNKLQTKNDFPSDQYREAVSRQTINSNELVNRVCLDKINNVILNAKEQFELGDDN